MADRNDVLRGLSDEAVDELRKALEDRGRRKVDWNNMTDAERAAVNRTTEPVTPMVPYQEYPKTLYGLVNGSVQAAPSIANAEEEADLKRKFPEARWTGNLMEFGIETCPSKPMGANQAAFIPMGQPVVNPATDVVNNPAPEVRIPTYEEQMHPLAKKRGRPPKAAAA